MKNEQYFQGVIITMDYGIQDGKENEERIRDNNNNMSVAVSAGLKNSWAGVLRGDR